MARTTTRCVLTFYHIISLHGIVLVIQIFQANLQMSFNVFKKMAKNHTDFQAFASFLIKTCQS